MSKDISFSIDKSFYQPIKGLSDEMMGKLFRAIFEYQVNGSEDCDPEIAVPFQFFQSKFEQDAIKKNEIKRKRTECGSKGGLAKKMKQKVIEKAKPKELAQKQPENTESVNLIYETYPAKCPVKGNNTGKCAKNKEQIEKLLQTHSPEYLISTIQSYVNDCKQSNTFIKNFSTFLNNLPDMVTTAIPEAEKKIKWMITSLNCEHKGSQAQMEQDKKIYGETNVQFLGYVY